MLPVRNVRSRFSGYRPQGDGRISGDAFDDGAAGAASYLQQAGFQPQNALMPSMPVSGSGYNPQATGFTPQQSGNSGDQFGGFEPMDIGRLSDDELGRMYRSQNALVGFMQTPGGMAARALGGALLPGVGSFFGWAQGPILAGYQNEMARRGLAMQTPEPGNWNSYDARAFDLGFYGIGDNALNAPGQRFAGQSTTLYGGNPATTGNWIDSASLPGNSGDDFGGWGGRDEDSFGGLGGFDGIY